MARNAKKKAASTSEPGKMVGDQTENQKGGDVKADAKPDHLRAGVRSRDADEEQSVGSREVAEDRQDKVWSSDSKERWGEDQPSLADQLKSQMQIEGTVVAEDTKGEE